MYIENLLVGEKEPGEKFRFYEVNCLLITNGWPLFPPKRKVKLLVLVIEAMITWMILLLLANGIKVLDRICLWDSVAIEG